MVRAVPLLLSSNASADVLLCCFAVRAAPSILADLAQYAIVFNPPAVLWCVVSVLGGPQVEHGSQAHLDELQRLQGRTKAGINKSLQTWVM